jgi:hypothetical protein
MSIPFIEDPNNPFYQVRQRIRAKSKEVHLVDEDLNLVKLTLKHIKLAASADDKNEIKRAMVRKKLEYSRSFLSNGVNSPNQMVCWVVVWLSDLRMINEFIELSRMGIPIDFPCPLDFKTNLATFVVDRANDFFEYAKKEDEEPKYQNQFFEFIEELMASDLFRVRVQKQAISKFYKYNGRYLRDWKKDDDAALKSFYQAKRLYEKYGCEGDIKKLEKKLGKIQELKNLSPAM